ncbi:MAG: hypothetical protein ACTSVC_02050 [Promethearchaeota archaeon]
MKASKEEIARKIDSYIVFVAILVAIFHVTAELSSAIMGFERNYLTFINFRLSVVEAVLYLLAYITAYKLRDNRFGQILLGVLLYMSGSVLFDIVQRLTTFTLAQFLWGTIILLGLIALLFIILKVLYISYKELREYKTYLSRLKRGLKDTKIITWIFVVITIGLSLIYFPMKERDYGVPIEIAPKDYQIQIRMWAPTSPSYYINHPNGTQMLEQMDRNNVTIQNTIFSIRDAEGKVYSLSPTIYPADMQRVVSNLTWFKDHYPHIKFQYYAYGLGYDSNGNYEGSIYTTAMLKRFVDICRVSNLTNVVGVYTDWEGPNRSAPKIANQTLNGWHQAMWYEGMAYTKAYFPNWTFSCCFPEEMIYDPLDGDADLQYFKRYNVFMPMWDDYGPMVYRSCNIDPNERQPGSYSGSWMIYEKAYTMVNGLFNGNASKVSMWLGCTGCGPYNNKTIVYEHGAPINFYNSTGFDAYARDILILKHFGIPTFSIFLAAEKFDQSGEENQGFFDQFGYNDSLDRLNEIINGPNSTKPFIIWSEGDRNPIRNLIMDYQLNFNDYRYLPLYVAYFFMAYIGAKWAYYIDSNLADRIAREAASKNETSKKILNT